MIPLHIVMNVNLISLQGWDPGQCPHSPTGAWWPHLRSRGHSLHSLHSPLCPPGQLKGAVPFILREPPWVLATMADTQATQDMGEDTQGDTAATADIRDMDTATIHYRGWVVREGWNDNVDNRQWVIFLDRGQQIYPASRGEFPSSFSVNRVRCKSFWVSRASTNDIWPVNVFFELWQKIFFIITLHHWPLTLTHLTLFSECVSTHFP